jgi:hypothetical protein
MMNCQIERRAVAQAQPAAGAWASASLERLRLMSSLGPACPSTRDLVLRRYRDTGLILDVEPSAERPEDDDVVCSIRDGDSLLGTLSVRFDGHHGLNADLLFAAELAEWRAAGVSLCEFGGFAIEPHGHDPRMVLAQIFQLGYLHAHRGAGCERLVIEVNPKHVSFYRKWLGLQVCSEARHNPRVEAPAVLMTIDFDTVRTQIARWGGQRDAVAAAGSLYPLAWGPEEEARMLAFIR